MSSHTPDPGPPSEALAGHEPLRLGDLQLEILRVLWRAGEATVAQVHGVVGPTRGSTASTIATMLSKMEARGLVAHRKSGRAFLYRATVAEDHARRSMVQQVTTRMFGGDPLELVNHLVTEEALGEDDLDALRVLIEARLAQRDGTGHGAEDARDA